MEHLEMIEEFVSTTCSNGVPPDYLRCRLFIFSIADKGLRWYKSLLARCFTKCDEVKGAFLCHFYTKYRSNQLTNMVHLNTSLKFGNVLRNTSKTVSHGFSQKCLLNTFYRGVEGNFQLSIDTASNADFITKYVEDASHLIEMHPCLLQDAIEISIHPCL